MDDMANEIAEIVAEVAEVDRAEVRPGRTLKDIGVQSLMGIEIAVHVERRYGIRFDDHELGEMETFDDLVSLARARLALVP